MSLEELKVKPWWEYLVENQKDLLEESFILTEREERLTSSGLNEEFHDYAFLVFPAAKAYEGFLKKLFLDLEFISPELYSSKHFRIGRSLNPQLPRRFRSEWVWDKLASFCQGEDLGQFLWDTWRESRNLTFHWFPQHKNFITLEEAKERIEMIVEAIDRAFEECKVGK